jgi:ankyrin repeat protein
LRDHEQLEAAHDDIGWTVAHDYIRIGDITLLSHQLQLSPRLIHLRDCWGATALHWAANFANIDAISALLAAGADVNAVCRIGDSSLSWASRSGSVACCRTIIDAGADLQHKNVYRENALMRCVSWNSTDGIVDFFIRSGIDLEVQSTQGLTALMLASRFSSPEILGMLLDAGASIDAQDYSGRSALWDTIRWNRHDNIRFLIDRGTSFLILDEDDDSILVWVAIHADIDTMSILKEAGIKSLPMDADSVDDYWCYFNARDKFFSGHRAPLQEEEEAFLALLDSIIPSSEPPPPITVKRFDIPGAFPDETTDELDSSSTSEVEDSSEGDDTDND